VHQHSESIRLGEIWMAAEAKKPKGKKTTQRAPSRQATSGKKVAKAGTSSTGKKRSSTSASQRSSSVAPPRSGSIAPARSGPARPSQPPSAKRPKSSIPPAKGGGKAADIAKKAAAQRDREKASRDKEQLKAQRDKQLKDKERVRQQAERDKERLRSQRDKERDKQLKDKERLRLEKQKAQERQKSDREKETERLRQLKEKELSQREKDQQRAEQAKAKADAVAERVRDKERVEAEKEAARLRDIADKKAEKDRLAAERNAARDRQVAEKLEEREAQRREREAELVRQKADRDTEKEAQRLEKDAERVRLKVEREAERVRLKVEREAERDRQREETRRVREEERVRQATEREAFRKAKEGEQTRIRTERAAARRALEGRVARASNRAQGGARASTTTRVYSPRSIPDQSGTRRDGSGPISTGFTQPPPSSVERSPGYASKPRTLPPPPPPPEPPATVEERYAKVMARLRHTSEDFRSAYEENFLMSWIHHDSALEGVVYTYEELRTAVNPNVTVVPDSSLQSVCEEIRRHKAAIELVRELGERKRQPATLDQLKRIFLTLHPEEGDLKTVRYRKDIPQHRMYFHEYAAPDKIPYKVRQIFDWLNGPDAKKLKSPLRVAGRVHYDLIRIFPFTKDSGKVARLFMNMLLLRADYPPAILHSTERQRYYEALKGSPNTITSMLESAIANALQSIDRQLGTQDTRLRAIVS
jgi:hypothetical protein